MKKNTNMNIIILMYLILVQIHSEKIFETKIINNYKISIYFLNKIFKRISKIEFLTSGFI